MASHDYYYNEHDENQVDKILKTKKKKKLKRRFKVLFVLFVLILIVAFFLSDYSKVQSIKVVGNEEIKTDDILNSISVNKESIFILVNTSKIEDEVKQVNLVKKANVSRDFFGNIKIEVEEADKVAYSIIDNVTYVIDEMGNVTETKDKAIIQSLQACPMITKFKDLKLLKSFAKQYVEIPELIKSQTSDIVYDPKKMDETRLKFIMDNGKILYLRIEDMVKQLKSFDYEANIAHDDMCVFKFEGNNIYKEACK
ncbi:MAG: FtsQ-type POTRA domain-containing protein [Coprobacillus sp.]